MTLDEVFDSVIMLTWSNWRVEPRSNRYHYATRFAKIMPVIFVQPWLKSGSNLRVEASEINNLDIVNVSEEFGSVEVIEFLQLLSARGIRKPLLWIYNTRDYQAIIEALPNSFRVYHATEDYLSDAGCGALLRETFSASVLRTLPYIDLLIGVTSDVVSSYVIKGGYQGPAVVVENGCDAQFFRQISHSVENNQKHNNQRLVAIYQGGINERLDFDLIHKLVRLLPDWDFWFVGNADYSLDGLQKINKEINVKNFGVLSPHEFGELMCKATVGLIPFVQDAWIKNSLPLKAFEYVACGLPVVTVPIRALERFPMVFDIATNAEEFALALCSGAQKRYDKNYIELRAKAANEASYDKRFEVVSEKLLDELHVLKNAPRSLNVVMLYDERWVHINTIREHIEAFKKYSTHKFHFVPAVGVWKVGQDELKDQFDFSVYDALIVHYSVRLSLKDYLNEAFARLIENFRGLKLLFIQDEYEMTENARQWMDRLQFDVVYTCVPEEARGYVYPKYRFPNTDFISTLTGYVPEDIQIDSYSQPMRERSTLIGYRGRILPYVYGTLGHDKHMIGVNVKKYAADLHLPVDIEVDDSKRIYGTDWYKFLGSVRATLGTESGSNVFDFDGSVNRQINSFLEMNPNASFDEVYKNLLSDKEKFVRMNQISPKIFEAIRLRTALVLFEGEYSYVIKPNIHFIPLKKDYSNLEEVFGRLQDVEFLEALTKRAYSDVIESNKYSYQNFVRSIDSDISNRVMHAPAYELICSPILARGKDGSVRAVLPKHSLGYVLSNQPFGGAVQREEVTNLIDSRLKGNDGQNNIVITSSEYVTSPTAKTRLDNLRFARFLWRKTPILFRTILQDKAKQFVNANKEFSQSRSIFYVLFRPVWRSLPTSLRTELLHILQR